MKKLITICFFMAISFNVIAQNILNGTLGSYSYNNVCNKYTNLNWEVSYKFEKRTDGIYLIYNNPKVTVAQNSLYATAEKNYSKQELGLSAWPQSYTPSSLNVSVNCRLPNGKVELSGATFSSSDPYRTYEDWVCSTTLNGQEVNLSAFNLSVTKASYNPQPVREIDDIINQKKSKTSTSYSSNSQNSESKNPLASSQSSTTQTNSQIPSLESQYAKLGIPTNTPTSTKQELTNQVATQTAGLMGEVLNDWGDNIEKKRAAKEAEREAKNHTETMAAIEKADLRFNTVYLPLMNLAEKGNENARMILYFTSEMYKREFLVPLREQWLEEAYYNKNFDAIIRKSLLVISEKDGYKNSIPLLEKAANMGSVDAMMMLASFYDLARSSVFSGGEDPKKALEWYNKAAENGSPNAMYLLGRIYKYGRTPDLSGSNGFVKKWHVKYDVVLDEKVAFDWFTKSLRPDYIESIYSRTIKISLRDFGLGLDASYFNKKSYLELANIYEKGKAIPKDKAKAIELMNLYGDYVNTQIIE